jgi:hypothetical protein
VKFKTPALEFEFGHLHPDVKRLGYDLDAFLFANQMPELVITHVLRTDAQSEEIYWRSFLKGGLSEPEARKKAREKFSWHKVLCAFDARTRNPGAGARYTKRQMEDILAFLKKGRDPAMWELLAHDVSGPHLHVGRRDFAWRTKHQKEQRS